MEIAKTVGSLAEPQAVSLGGTHSTKWVPLSLFCLAALLGTQRPYMGSATAAYGLMVAGLLNRGTRKIHISCMVLAMILDLSIVIALELSRGATAKVVGSSMSPLQLGHVAFSSLALVLYVPVAVLGSVRARGKAGSTARKSHLITGMVAFVARTIGFLLMFSLFWRNG